MAHSVAKPNHESDRIPADRRACGGLWSLPPTKVGWLARLACIPLLIVGGVVDPLWGLAAKLLGATLPRQIPAKADSPRRRKRGLTLILGGIEGPSPFNMNMALGLLDAGYRGAVVRCDWNAGIPFWQSLVNLTWNPHQSRQSDRVVEIFTRYRKECPHAPINIIAQSGGCWIAIRALERLPNDVRVDTVVLIAPSMSPGRDVSAAAAQCDSALVSIGSCGDLFFLGLGTTLLGTSDRRFGPSSGLVGWRRRSERFVSLRWRPEWLRHGYFGNHTTSGARRFIAAEIAPRLPWRRPTHH